MKMLRLVLNILSVFVAIYGVSEAYVPAVHYMTPESHYKGSPVTDSGIPIFCYKGSSKHVFHIWQTVYVSIGLQPEEYTLYHGGSPEEVQQLYENHKSSWIRLLFTWRRKSITLNPFGQTCIGIETGKSFHVSVNVIHIDFWKVILLVSGVFIFLAAPRLSSNPVFYYICGVVLGVTTSLLIAFYLISKLIPRKPAIYGFLVGGWTVSVYLLQLLWDNIKTIALNYQKEVLVYILVTGVISFIVCYRFGPVTDVRSRNLIKWALQSVSLAAIFYSSAYEEMSVLCILALLLYYNFPRSWTSLMLVFWKKRFPPKVKLLTDDEYHEQGARETVKALEELRNYCSSPECKQWKTVLSLREPIRFAQFVEGKSHLSDSEILQYEAEARDQYYTETEDSDEDINEYNEK